MKLVFFDNDGTLTTNRVAWVYMHRHLGTYEPHGRSLLEEHISGRTPYDEFARQSVRLWKGIPQERFVEKISGIEIRRGVHEVVHLLRDAGLKLAVISSGFSLWKEVWEKREGIVWDYYMANDLVFDSDGIFTGEIEMHVTDNVPGTDKASLVEKIGSLEGASKDERVFVGDGRGDAPAFKVCAFGIAIEPETDEVRKAARFVLSGDDFGRVADLILSAVPGTL